MEHSELGASLFSSVCDLLLNRLVDALLQLLQ